MTNSETDLFKFIIKYINMLSNCMGIFSLNFSVQLVKFKDEKEVADENTD